jgi:hypothetical protein
VSFYDNYLNGVAALSDTNLWSVGSYNEWNNERYQTLIEQWDGSAWSVVASPNVDTMSNELYAVAAAGANDVWAVGYSLYDNGTDAVDQALVEHWDGTAWQVIPNDNVDLGASDLYGVAALSATDVWAVGQYYDYNDGLWKTLAQHWDGTAWTVVATPDGPTGSGVLESVAAVSATDVWAVGYAGNGSDKTLILHWDGSAWAVVPSPNVGTDTNDLYGVAALSATDVWAVGTVYEPISGVDQTLITHWDGSAWTVVPSPNPGVNGNYLYGIAASSGTDVWAVGDYYDSDFIDQTLVAHWDGSAWSAVLSPNVAPGDNGLSGVAVVSATTVWAAGTYWNLSGGDGQTGTARTLTVRYDVVCPPATVTPEPPTATVTSTPTATAPPPPSSTPVDTATPLPSSTPLPPSSTPVATATPMPSSTVVPPSSTPLPATATATPCVATFSDVHPDDFFAAPIQYLACHGVISGYPGGVFRPANNTIRAQMIKIVVLGFAVPLVTPPAGGYTFADVPPGFNAFTVIETAAANHMITGYPCGGLYEPCDPQQRPYYRPNSDVSRGQLVKMTVTAAGLTNPVPPTQQTFEDVPPANAFWVYVERLAPLNVINGYPCGQAPAGGCVSPGNRPYFVPDVAVTRGQTTKIVFNTIMNTGGHSPR